MMISCEMYNEKIIKHSGDLQRFIYTLTRDNYAKDEILQNTIIRAYKSFESLKNPDSFYPWIMQIARTEAIRYHHSEKNWADYCTYEEGNPEDFHDATEDFNKVENEELTAEIMEFIENLKCEYAQILLLYFKYQMSLTEIAKTLDRNYNTVKSQYSRGLELVREKFKSQVKKGEGFTWLITE